MDKRKCGKVIKFIVSDRGPAYVCGEMSAFYKRAARAARKDPEVQDKYRRLGKLLDPENLKEQDPVIEEPVGVSELK